MQRPDFLPEAGLTSRYETIGECQGFRDGLRAKLRYEKAILARIDDPKLRPYQEARIAAIEIMIADLGEWVMYNRQKMREAD